MKQWLCPTSQAGDECYSMHDGQSLAELRWACTEQGPTHANCPSTDIAVCYGCKQPLDHVRSHKRSRLGTQFVVKPFYRHRTFTAPKVCGDIESIHHMAAKDAAVKYANKLRYHYVCVECNTKVDLNIPLQQNCTASEEVTWYCPQGNKYRLDVAMISQCGKVVGAVEIYHTHRTDSNKANGLSEGNLDWCEVTAKRILDAVENQSWTVEVVQCGFEVCCNCVEKLRAKEFARLDKLRADELKSRRLVHDQRKTVLARAEKDWFKLNGILPDRENEQWKDLRYRVLCSVVEQAKICGMNAETNEISKEIDIVLDSEATMLTFGKHKLRTVSEVAAKDWPYLLWLGGYDFGRLDENCKPLLRRADTPGVAFVTKSIEATARSIIKNRCFVCSCHTQFSEPWKRVCVSCYKSHKRSLW